MTTITLQIRLIKVFQACEKCAGQLNGLYLIAALLIYLGICPALLAQAPVSNPSFSSQLTTTNEDVPISPGDLISVMVFDTPEFSGTFRISNEGNLKLPLIGELHLAGLSSAEGAKLIQTKLIQGNFLKDPQVSISFIDFINQSAVILGDVMKPGAVPVLGSRTLWEIVGAAGGVNNTAGDKVLLIHRSDPAHPQEFDIKWDQDLAGQPNPKVSPGDTVQIVPAGIVYVVGQVGRQGAFPIIHEKMTMLQLISLSEGPKLTAKSSAARLIRKTTNGRQISTVNIPALLAGKVADFTLQNDDILYVPNSTSKVVIYRGLEAAVSITTSLAVYRIAY